MKKKIYLIGNAHIDPVWLWRWQEGFAEIKATFRSALDRMKEFDDFHFTSACAVYYEWIEKSDPSMFREIQDRVKEGRFHIVGGWFLQPDCNIPSGESFARHALISQRYFKEKFGITAKTGYNVDSFGHNGNLPQILRKSGMENYVFMRPQPNEKELKQSCFIWESMDGSSVTAFRIPFIYNIGIHNFDKIHQIDALAEKENIDMMAFYGVGNHGGGPTVQLLEKLHKDGLENMVFSDCDTYFNQTDRTSLPVLRDDLQYHAKGCYSACSKIKRDNRICEHNLLTAEKFAVFAKILCGDRYPAAKLRKAWKNVLFNQFHDIMGGCAIKAAYNDASYLHGESMSITEQAINFALQQISWNIDTIGNAPLTGNKDDWKIWTNEVVGTPVVIFNPLPWEVTVPVQLNAMPKKVCNENGEELPIQRVRGRQTNGSWDKSDTLLLARVPAMGYTTYRMYLSNKGKEFSPAYDNTDYKIENEYLKAVFDPKTKKLSSLFDKKENRELLSDSCGAFFADDTENDTWAHGTLRFDKPAGDFLAESVRLLENGPVRSVIRQIMKCRDSLLRQDYILYAGKDELEIHATVDCREKHRILKMRIPVKCGAPEVYCEIPYGYIRRENNGDEHVGGQWICVTNARHEGLGIANDSKYSFDVKDEVVSLTVLRTAAYADHFGTRDEFCEYLDMGEQVFTYCLHPFRSISDTVRKAYQLNVPERHITETFHKGKLPVSYSAVNISDENIVLTALKQADDGDGIIIRCYETENRDTPSTIDLPILNTVIRSCFGHNEIKTFRVSDAGKVTETDMIESICSEQTATENVT